MVSTMIRDYLTSHGISQKFLAQKSGISKWKIHDIVTGNCKILVSDYCKICNALEVDFNSLLPSELKPTFRGKRRKCYTK